MIEVFKIEVLVIDHDGVGEEEIKHTIENTRYPNRCISPEVKSMKVANVEWSDDHPLNICGRSEREYLRLFSGKH